MKWLIFTAGLAATLFYFGACTLDDDNGKEVTSTPIETATSGRDDVTTTESGLVENIADGAILHCWSWSFDTIRENLDDIAAAGFSAIQTSPVSQCKAGDSNKRTSPGTIGYGNDGNGTDAWYYHYQPTDFVIGNYQLGTEDEFKEMCKAAHEKGIKVIVDAVLNHCSSDWNAISDNVKALGSQQEIFHTASKSADVATERYEITQYKLAGLWDLNTGNTTVQNYILSFLKQCVTDGADGFRYDAAKHIELPDDDSHSSHDNFQSNFWPTILENGAVFQYGEILGNTDSSTRLGAYQALNFGDEGESFRTTASAYGEKLRTAIKNNNLLNTNIKDYNIPSGSENKLVTWIESHDNYCNDDYGSGNSWTPPSEAEIIRGYAIIASRYSGTPLFFDRPDGSGITQSTKWGNNQLGKIGSAMFKDAQVKAVNFFRNHAGNAGETLSNPGNNTGLLMIQRGSKGFVIINNTDETVTITDADVKGIADGKYKDAVSPSSSSRRFTVKDGKASGKILAGKVAVFDMDAQ